jgi:antitoxin component of RelBE/YafQ-DinJ toxin-antitoxin module
MKSGQMTLKEYVARSQRRSSMYNNVIRVRINDELMKSINDQIEKSHGLLNVSDLVRIALIRLINSRSFTIEETDDE